MDLGIIGLERSGKTTVFNAITRGHAHAGSFGGVEPSIGVVKQPDERLDQLCELLKPRKVTHVEQRLLDFPGGLSLRGDGTAAAHLAALSQCDLLIHVVRAFRNEAVPHPEGGIDPERDIASVDLELAFADAAMLERRVEKLEITVRSSRAGERDAGERELATIQRLREALEREEPLRAQELSPDERRMLSGYQLLTNKPLVVALNVGEEDAPRVQEVEAEHASEGPEAVALCGKLEQELSELPDEEAAEFRRDLGLEQDGVARLLQAGQRALGQIAFFTVGDTEGRAWSLTAGSTALDAGGKVHSDIARGFIRAEVIGWDEMLACGGWAEAKKRGQLRTEGKQYVVQDGDLVNILFNV